MTANLDANVHATGQHKAVPMFQRLRPLLTDYAPPCLSLYQPTYRAFPEAQQNVVRYRNLLKELKAALQQRYREADHAALLEPFERLLEDDGFWSHPQDGIAVFGAAGLFQVEKVQRPVPEMVVANDHLYLRPLVRVFQSEDTYQILALDRESISMYQGNRYVVDEIVMAPSIPRTIEEALGEYVTIQGTHKQGSSGPGRPGVPGAGAIHGHGSKADEAKLDAERFFRAIDRAVLEGHSKPSELPLMLAALPEHQAVFRSVSRNAWLLEEGIPKHPRSLDPEELRTAAWRVMEPRYHKRLQALLDAWHAAKARALATDDLTHAVEFAIDGRVGTLLLEADRRIPGHIEGRMPRRTDRDEPGASDILDDLAERVLKTGGQVVVAPLGSMPTDKGVAATFRY